MGNGPMGMYEGSAQLAVQLAKRCLCRRRGRSRGAGQSVVARAVQRTHSPLLAATERAACRGPRATEDPRHAAPVASRSRDNTIKFS